MPRGQLAVAVVEESVHERPTTKRGPGGEIAIVHERIRRATEPPAPHVERVVEARVASTSPTGILQRVEGSSTLELVNAVRLPSTQDVPEYALLVLIPGQVVDVIDGEHVGERLSAYPTLRPVDIERILRKGISGSGKPGREDFARIIDGFAKGVRQTSVQPVPVLEVQPSLQAIVDGERGVGAQSL